MFTNASFALQVVVTTVDELISKYRSFRRLYIYVMLSFLFAVTAITIYVIVMGVTGAGYESFYVPVTLAVSFTVALFPAGFLTVLTRRRLRMFASVKKR